MKKKLLITVCTIMLMILTACSFHEENAEGKNNDEIPAYKAGTFEILGDVESDYCQRAGAAGYITIHDVAINGKTFSDMEVLQCEYVESSIYRANYFSAKVEELDSYNDDKVSFVSYIDSNGTYTGEITDIANKVIVPLTGGTDTEVYLHILLKNKVAPVELNDCITARSAVDLYSAGDKGCPHAHVKLNKGKSDTAEMVPDNTEKIKEQSVDMSYIGTYELGTDSIAGYCEFCEMVNRASSDSAEIDSFSNAKYEYIELFNMNIDDKNFKEVKVIALEGERYDAADSEKCVTFKYEDEKVDITLLSVTSGDHYGYIIDKAHPLMRTSDKDHTYYPNISLYACGETPVTVNDCITALHAFDFEQAEKDGIKHIHVSPVLN